MVSPARGVLLLLGAVPAFLSAQAPTVTPNGDPSIDDGLVYARAVSPSDFPGRDYVLLFDDGIARIAEDGKRRTTYRKVVQVLSQDGVEEWSELAYGYDPTLTKLTLNWLRVYSSNGKLVSKGPAHEHEAPPDVSFDAPVYTSERIRRYSVASLEPGGILDVSITFDTFNPRHPSDFLYSWALNTTDPVQRSRFIVDLPATFVPRVQQRNVVEGGHEYLAGDRHVLEWQADSVPAIEVEPFAGSPNDVVRLVRISSGLTWDSIADWYHHLAQGRYTVTDDLRAALAEQLVGARTQRDSIAAVHRWVAQDFRYVSLSLGDGGYQPRPAGEVFESRFGDCKDKTTLFIAVLATMGIDAHPVLTSASGRVDSLAPSMHQFTHQIAAVDTRRGREFADLTSELTPFGRLPYELQGRVGLLVTPDGAGDIVVFPTGDPDASLRHVTIAGKLTEDGAFDGGLTMRATGWEEHALRNFIGDVTEMEESDLLLLGEQLAQAYVDRAQADSVQMLNGVDLSTPPQAVVWMKVSDLVTRSGTKYVLPLPLPDYSMDAAVAALEEDTLRQFPIDVAKFNGPSRHRTEFIVSLPPGWRAELPPDVEVEGTFGRYHATYQQQGNTILIMRELAGRAGIEPPDSVGALIEWMRAVGQDRADYVVIEHLTDVASTDSVEAVTSIPLAFDWPVGMTTAVRQRVQEIRSSRDAAPDTAVSETSYRITVGDHEDGRLIAFRDFTIEEQSEDYKPGFAALTEQAAEWIPGFVVDQTGTFLGLEDFEGFLDLIQRGMNQVLDSLGTELPGLRDLMERTLTEEFYSSKAREFWAPLVYAWSETEMELGVDYTTDTDEPSPLFPEVLIPFHSVARLESRVPCREGRSDSACVLLRSERAADRKAITDLLTTVFADMLEGGAQNVPVVESFDSHVAATLVTEPATLIPHHMVVRWELAVSVRDSTGARSTSTQVRNREYWFDYREFAADSAAPRLIRAAMSGDLETVVAAIQAGEDIEQRDGRGRTPLIAAAADGHVEVVRLLLFRNADVRATDRVGKSALVWAAAGGYDTVCSYLVQAGASADDAYRIVRERGIVSAVPTLVRVGVTPDRGSASALFDSARAVFDGGDFAASLPLFMDALAADTSRTSTMAWVADVLRRVDKAAEAIATARMTLQRDTCNGHSLSVVARTFHLGPWEVADPDSAWAYFTRGAECAPQDGDTWMDLVFAAAERGEYELEREALRRMAETGLYMRPTMSMARWMLESTPDSAILVTGGDMDTFPLLALQETEALRRDVAIVNRALLEAQWYRDLVTERYGVPRPDRLRETLARSEMTEEERPTTAGDTAIAAWRAVALDGDLARPLVLSMTLEAPWEVSGPGVLEYHGPYALVVDSARPVDPRTVYETHVGLDPEDFVGPAMDLSSRSPYVRNTQDRICFFVATSAMIPVMVIADDEWLAMDTATVRHTVRLLDWGVRFGRETECTGMPTIGAMAADGYIGAGRAFAQRGDLRAAIEYSRLAMDLDSTNTKAPVNIGYYSLVLGDADTALPYLEAAYADTPALATLMNLVDASRLMGDLEAARGWAAEAESLAVGERLNDEAFMWESWTYDYSQLGDTIDLDQLPTVQAKTVDEKLAMMHYWEAITEAVAGAQQPAEQHLATARTLSPRADLQCVVHNRIDALLHRFADRAAMVLSLRALAAQLTRRDIACAVDR